VRPQARPDMTKLAGPPARRSVHELFEAQAARNPHATATLSDDDRLTYDELNRRANRLAHHLISLGVRPETLVGLVLDRTPGTLVALLAILKAGGAYVPLDPALPLDRLNAIMVDARMPILVRPSPGTRPEPAGARVVDVVADRHLIERQPVDNPSTGVSPQNLAYCVYTSGSTGTPKGVAVPGGNLVNQVTCMTRALGIRPGDRLLQFTSIAMDAALQEIFPAWLGGGTLVLHSERVPSIPQFMRLLNEQSVSVVSVPSSYWHHWVDELVRSPAKRPQSLRMVYVGGERILADRLRQWRALAWGTEVEWLADYGPTETTLSCMTYTGPPADEWQSVPLGRPIANMRIHILDEDLAAVPPGTTGELFIAGVGVSRGYLNRPGLTADRFLPNPFGPPGTRMYRTGDQGFELPGGRIQFVGRVDDQVKIHGHRIELGDVQSALLRCDGVRDAVVVAREQAPGDTRLVGYVIAPGLRERALREQLATLLPTGMIPATLVPVPEIPRSPVTGKVDRRQLPDPAAAKAPPPLADDTPDPELAIAVLFAEILGRPPRSHDEDFFAAGGDSLRALRLLGRLADLTGTDLTFAEFSRAPTVRALAALVATAPRRQNCQGGGLVPRSPDAQAGSALRPASHAQQRLWFLHKLQFGVATYSIPLGYRVRGPLSLEKLDGALTTIVARHEALRTALVERNGAVLQEIAPPMPIRTRLLEADGLDEALVLAHAEASLPFDLTRAPLLRTCCIRTGADEYLFVLNVHHSVFDAWSLGLFWRELNAIYAELPLKPQVFQYADYVDWQNDWLRGAEAASQRAFWREQLDGELPLLGLSPGTSVGDSGSSCGDVEDALIDADTRRAVNDLAQRGGATEFAVLLTAFLAALYRYFRQEQIVVGVPVACRTPAETEGIIGYFTNTVALRMSFAPDQSFAGLLDATSKALSEVMTRQELPFDVVVDALTLPRQADRSPVFEAMFVMQDTLADQTPRIDGLDIEEVPVHSGTAKVELTCAIRSTPAGLTSELEYTTDLFDRPRAARWLASLQHLLADAAQRPHARLDELVMTSAAERAAVVARANERFDTYPDLRPLHARFEELARRGPDAVAIEAGRTQITYGELNRRADRLARSLMAAGAGPERAVGICIERSAELVVALLATLKAGAAFVPLDPDLPKERIRVITEDVGSSAIITRGHHRDLLTGLMDRLVVEPPDGDSAAAVSEPVSMENAAYIYYTSGSTGEPKGVVIDHRCAGTRLEWLMRRFPLAPGERLLHKTPLIFDVAIWEIFGPLSMGATILMADPGAQADVGHLGRLLGRERTVVTHFVPSMLDAYLSLAPRRPYPDLRWVHLSGEAVSPRLLERFTGHFSAEFHNMYGQTETSEVAAWEGRGPTGDGAVPIGGQVGAYRLFVLDAALDPVPPGVPGELYVAGLGGLARGYHGRPTLTARSFVPNPYAVAPGERLYRTGDLVSADEDGVLTYLGRIDEQTKIRGCRVEVGEVEAVLARHPAIRVCAVVARPDEHGANRLVAYVVGDQLPVTDLAAHAARFLPSYLLPEVYVELAALPLTPSGKLDRRGLPAPTAADREARTGHEEARTPLEAELGHLWKELLGVGSLGHTDNFFTIGGNSLKCLQVLHRVNATYGVELSVRDFFGAPTIRDLTAQIERALVAAVAAMSDDEAVRRLRELEE
jgi:amino acid adenylation domain-containing protein